jgi:hypothetical protein
MSPMIKAAIPLAKAATQGSAPAPNTNSSVTRILNTIAHPGRHNNTIGKNNIEIVR